MYGLDTYKVPLLCTGNGGNGAAARHPSVAPSEVEGVMRSIVPYGSGVSSGELEGVDDVLEDVLPLSDSELDNEQQYETSVHAKSAAEKHAFLHPQHGLEDSLS